MFEMAVPSVSDRLLHHTVLGRHLGENIKMMVFRKSGKL
jgi:hypothetical protein